MEFEVSQDFNFWFTHLRDSKLDLISISIFLISYDLFVHTN